MVSISSEMQHDLAFSALGLAGGVAAATILAACSVGPLALVPAVFLGLSVGAGAVAGGVVVPRLLPHDEKSWVPIPSGARAALGMSAGAALGFSALIWSGAIVLSASTAIFALQVIGLAIPLFFVAALCVGLFVVMLGGAAEGMHRGIHSLF